MEKKRNDIFGRAFAVLEKIGRSLMIPVAILPAAGLLLGIGAGFQQKVLIEKVPFLGNHIIQYGADLMVLAGGVVFGNLPLLFAIGVAIGFSAGGDGVGALAAVLGFLIMNVIMGKVAGVTAENIATSGGKYTMVMGIPTLQTGVFGGIIAGLIGASMFNKYYKIELPQFLGFFAGKRFVPIATAVVSLIVGALMPIIWTPIQIGLLGLSNLANNGNTNISTFIFGIIERALIPFGLHHVFYLPFWQTSLGGTMEVAGKMVDVGAGAGFPGIVTKIYKPELELTLMEPTGKRVEFLKYACGQLGLTGVEFAKERAEEAARKVWREQFDLASARAVAALPMLAEYCLPLVKVGGNFLAMKGASGEEELAAARGAIKKLGGEYKETRTLHLPGGDTRTLILCKKISQTPTAYPRNGGKIAKSPLK